MKPKLFFLFVLIHVFTFSQNLKVMTYNIRLSLDSDKENSWENRKTEALKLMNYYHPDFFGVQEAVPQQMIEIKMGLKNYNFVGVGRDDGANMGEYSAIFYDNEKLEIIKSGTFWLSEHPEKPGKGWDAGYNRVCTYALLRYKKTGQEFWAFNTHLDNTGTVARLNSTKLILKKIKELNSKNLPIVLTGDFNSLENSEPIVLISKELENAYTNSETKPYGPKGTFNDFDINKIPAERIDYIFTKNFKVINFRTINDRRENLLYPSDHFPILVEMKFK